MNIEIADSAEKPENRLHTNDRPNVKEKWAAVTIETQLSGMVLLPGVGGAYAFGTTLVGFTNLATGESFAASYFFKLIACEGAGLSAWGLSVQAGVVVADFPSGSKQTDIAESYSGPFITKNLSVGPIVGSSISSEKWHGSSLGASFAAGFPVALTSFETDYSHPSYINIPSYYPYSGY